MSGLSSTGSMKFKQPIKDFYLKSMYYGFGNDSSFFVFSYSIVADVQNDFMVHMRTAPTHITREMDD